MPAFLTSPRHLAYRQIDSKTMTDRKIMPDNKPESPFEKFASITKKLLAVPEKEVEELERKRKNEKSTPKND